jgi:transglutaminase-like putative cysteine protease
MRLSIAHRTVYVYEQPPPYGLQQLRLQPVNGATQRVIDWSIELVGGREEAAFRDHNANPTTLVSLAPGAHEVIVACSGLVETTDTAGLVGPHETLAPLWRFTHATPLTRPGPAIEALAARLAGEGENDIARLHLLSSAILAGMRYDIGRTTALTTAEDALAAGHGVCQDHAHVFIAAARLQGFPARYVSGYLWMPDRVDQDAGHAWAEAHVAGLGWVGFDVSNGISPDARYVRVASGLDYGEAAPIRGIVVGESERAMTVAIAVQEQ